MYFLSLSEQFKQESREAFELLSNSEKKVKQKQDFKNLWISIPKYMSSVIFITHIQKHKHIYIDFSD